MSELVETKLIYETEQGSLVKAPVTLKYEDGRIWFVKSPFGLKDEIKAMGGSRWHGFETPKKMMWSVDDSFRNQFQLHYMMGENVYEWFERPLVEHEYSRPLMEHQKDLTNHGLTYRYQIWAAEMGTGKTLSAQEVIERAGVNYWYWVGPKTSLPNIAREFKKWNFQETCATIEYMTYERLVRIMDDYKDGDPLPGGVIFDESSRLKTATSQRSKAAFKLASLIRAKNNWDGYCILMSGTPSPKKPTDWWSQCEVTWPGFLREGTVKALEKRLAFQIQQEFDSGTFWKTIGWRDNEAKCNICGETLLEGPHELDPYNADEEYHEFVPSKNEVALMFERLNGLVVVKHKKDCLTLPDKRYRKIECKPSKSLLRVAKTLVDASPNAMTGMTLLRELSDGFQYREVDDGTRPCNHCPESKGIVDEWFNTDTDRTYQDISLLEDELTAKLEKRSVQCPKCHGSGEMKKTKRITREVPCPKEKALRELLEECEETGRIVIFAGFTGSVDRCVGICHKEGWAVLRCDGRGFQATLEDGETVTDEESLDFWANLVAHPRVAFVAHPESGGMSLTLVEARMAVYWSNSFKPEYRVQSEDRIHRKGMDENLGCVIVDLIHLPTDEHVVDIIRENRKLELMTMGEITKGIEWDVKEDGA
jgi:SNF2 family DNA or RNA helicase